MSRSSRMPVARGDIILIDFNPTKGQEKAGLRPIFVPSSAIETLAFMLPISQRLTLARSQGFTVTLMEAGTKTQGSIICNQPHTVSLLERGTKKIEHAPDVIIEEILLRIAPLVS